VGYMIVASRPTSNFILAEQFRCNVRISSYDVQGGTSLQQKHQNQFLLWEPSSTLFLSTDMTAPGSAAPNIELPATMQLAPADATNHKLFSANWNYDGEKKTKRQKNNA
jgi:hypothetical protein